MKEWAQKCLFLEIFLPYPDPQFCLKNSSIFRFEDSNINEEKWNVTAVFYSSEMGIWFIERYIQFRITFLQQISHKNYIFLFILSEKAVKG